MTLARSIFTAIAIAAVAAQCAIADPPAHLLSIRVEHTFGDAPLVFDDVSLRTSGGNTLSVSRLSYLISDVALIRTGAEPVRFVSPVAYINAPDGRTSFELADVPPGKYSGLSFSVGLDPARNHSDPSAYPATHPLNPVLNSLHWNWQGGYVFLAIEGRYVLPADQLGGYSYHIATDAHLMQVRIDREFTLDSDSELAVRFDVSKVFDARNQIVVRHAGGEDSTHSGPTDPFAARIAANISESFSFAGFTQSIATPLPAAPTATEPPAGTRRFFLNIPKGFSEPALPFDNPLTVEGVALGEKLFFEQLLSANNAQSCADCHKPSAAFADPGNALSKGVDGLPGHRNTMPLFNLAWMNSMTWDGKRARIRDQALAPIQDEREMHQSLEQCVLKLSAVGMYGPLFAGAFGSPGITSERIGLALEQYLLTLISADSKFDRAMREEIELNDEETRGLNLFVLEFDPLRGRLGADCFHCHGNELFTTNQFANNGLDSSFRDRGRNSVTGKPSDLGKFKVPSLRNVELTGPYMHDGRFSTLEEIIDHYADGVKPSDSLDPNISKHPEGGLALSCEDRKALVAFLKTLTDMKYREQAAPDER